MQFLVEVANEVGQIVVSTGKPYSSQLVQDIPAPPEVIEKLAILERVASKSYNVLCEQQEKRLGWLPTPQYVPR